ncbi:uncharacterized protein EV422DRAFT_163072 [Fimicolochytrium jonesii]|uniref:uncharacterized protein n=1 Tax=Fimicolochytrium jonesii TaxID=1396493 RepID=UPI0022FEE4F3|nr:uncharacterized protein EV422DRAFT_163072 [Fimicolochytrium jonesii]KAI8818732.1 hypothetical protein EV422DRAFT_163072 [Fimicolochytrium jonesii]
MAAGDHKKEDFRKYLEKNGIVDALTKVLVGLYEEPEKPENALEYVKQFLGGPSDVDVEALKSENEELRRKVEELQQRLDEAGGAGGAGQGAAQGSGAANPGAPAASGEGAVI